MARIVLHIDMDAFFASVEERYNPQFRGRPLVVGADPKGGQGRGVVSTCNYLARKYGIRSAMPISKAWSLAEAAQRRGEPATIFVEASYEAYAEISRRIMDFLRTQAAGFESGGIDEAYLELRIKNKELGIKATDWIEAEKLAQKIKLHIKKTEGLTASVGIGPNKLIAKIASDFKKPDGLMVVRPPEVIEFLAPLSIRVIPGIGPKAEIDLNKNGIKLIGDLQKLSEAELYDTFGDWGLWLARNARGESDSPVSDEGEIKSIGEQATFETDTLNPGALLDRLDKLCSHVFKRFRHSEFNTFRQVTITVRFFDFITRTRSKTLPKDENSSLILKREVILSFLPFLDDRENPKRKRIRLLGVRIEKFGRTSK
ncbi:MAG: DNA polymerase IV [Candidatus Sungbacteria bacterium]|uniref:DNA polymerase IV n=1 Tax=Candidatus Sungiibacteriota bacterium TaxID=2750080 RepID=A0A9D6LR17_9BACT|nr:DNA polymerase IV [Candidatus Sungbacteria bacterium]